MPVSLLLVVLFIEIADDFFESVDISGHREGPLADRGIEISVGKIIVKIRSIDKAWLVSEGCVPDTRRIVSDQG